MGRFQSKLPDMGSSIFAVMTTLSNRYNAVNLSQGFPDFNCDPQLIELVHKYQKSGKNQYAPMPGVLRLREEISHKVKNLYGGKYNPDSDITITSGATEALYTAITAFIDLGDEVIVFEPAYDLYKPVIELNGGIPVAIQMSEKDFSIDWNSVYDKVNSRTKMIIINTPHNPAGYVFTENDINSLTDVVHRNNLLLISDEVYEHIVFDGRLHRSIASVPDLKKHSLVISSFGKTYHTTGWKTGYCLSSAELMAEFRKIHQFVVFAVNTPIQMAYAEFMEFDNSHLDLSDFYQKKRDFLLKQLQNSPFKITPTQGTYFQLLEYSKITDMDDMKFAELLAEKAGVAVIPMSPFYSNEPKTKYIRLCFAKTDEVLKEGAKRLVDFVEMM